MEVQKLKILFQIPRLTQILDEENIVNPILIQVESLLELKAIIIFVVVEH